MRIAAEQISVFAEADTIVGCFPQEPTAAPPAALNVKSVAGQLFSCTLT